MLRKIRVRTAIISLCIVSLLFLDFTGTVHQWLGWIARIQLIPALFAVNVIAIIVLLFLTIVFGRLYCSVICPLGIFQDVVSWLAAKRKKNRFSHSNAINWMRYAFLAFFIVAFVAGLASVVALLDPYAAFGRIASNLVAPLWQWLNNGMAYLAERADSYAFYDVDVWVKSLSVLAVAAGTLVLVAILAWRHGRTYCNTVCPVGTFLGFISRFSWFKPVFDQSKCNSCGLCARNCKAACIDTKSLSIDYSRCVTCFDCVEKCNRDAMHYRSARLVKKTNGDSDSSSENIKNSRRTFFSLTALLAVSGVIRAQEKVAEGGLAVIKDKKMPKRKTPLTPPGSFNSRNFTTHCTACGLCISACPNQVLRPSDSLMSFMQPVMSYERGFCRPECTKCSEVCPTGAIERINAGDKAGIQIGFAVWMRDNCVVLTDDVDCGNCARHCPSGAIEMVASKSDNPNTRKIPAVNTERCIGCGACEYLCPSRPLSAIYVEGIESHRTV